MIRAAWLCSFMAMSLTLLAIFMGTVDGQYSARIIAFTGLSAMWFTTGMMHAKSGDVRNRSKPSAIDSRGKNGCRID